MTVVCVDAGFLIGLYQESDQYHTKAIQHFVEFFERGVNQLLVPWPTLYEAVSTRMVRNRNWIAALDQDWKRLRANRQLEFLNDQPYRVNALDDCLAEIGRVPGHYRRLSVADRVVRYMLADTRLRIDALITYNPADFRDTCIQYRRTLVS